MFHEIVLLTYRCFYFRTTKFIKKKTKYNIWYFDCFNAPGWYCAAVFHFFRISTTNWIILESSLVFAIALINYFPNSLSSYFVFKTRFTHFTIFSSERNHRDDLTVLKMPETRSNLTNEHTDSLDVQANTYICDAMKIQIHVENYAIAICLAQRISHHLWTTSFRINNYSGNAGTRDKHLFSS